VRHHLVRVRVRVRARARVRVRVRVEVRASSRRIATMGVLMDDAN